MFSSLFSSSSPRPKFLQCIEITFAIRILKNCFLKREVEHKKNREKSTKCLVWSTTKVVLNRRSINRAWPQRVILRLRPPPNHGVGGAGQSPQTPSLGAGDLTPAEGC